MIPKKLGIISLKPEQYEACGKLKSGSILMGGVGSGKTYTSIFWAASQYGVDFFTEDRPLIVITTAMKRDLIERGADKPDWQQSLENCGITNYIVDSWQNITKYEHIKNSVFIFDEQRVVGYGKWGKSFIRTCWKDNKWILLSATPGDVWMDYMTVFIANRFYRNKTDFTSRHVVWDPYVKFPKVKKYIGTAVLEKYRNQIVVPMKDNRKTIRHRDYIYTEYDSFALDTLAKTRWNPYTDEPILNVAEYTQLVRRIVNTDPSRVRKAENYILRHNKTIVFYNFNYELDILKGICEKHNLLYKEWNGKKHEHIPNEDKWVYLVQYTAGAEGWNCITANSILFYSVNYSYRKMEQAEGRIDRSNTKFTDLYYTYLTSLSKVDKDILKAVKDKKRFTEAAWGKKQGFIPLDMQMEKLEEEWLYGVET
nr:MAG TPA: Chromatin remodeling complex ATPase [Caudoviricetes sp.]